MNFPEFMANWHAAMWDPYTMAILVLFVCLIGALLFLCGYLANRPKNLLDLEHEIRVAESRLDYLLAERARRFPTSSKPSFTELQASADRMDHGL